MISLDIECSGLDFNKCGIWQIGAVDLITGENFLEESKIDENDIVLETSDSKRKVLEIIGKTEKELRDNSKQSQKEMIQKFLQWVSNKEEDIFLSMNPQFDISYIWAKARKYEIDIMFQFKAFDLHTIAQMKYLELNGRYNFEIGKSQMGLKRICEFCGLTYSDKNHDGLEDAKITAECYYRLTFGEKYFSEFEKFEIPKELKKQVFSIN